ncbi:MFS transporter [Aeromicrobium tamlense]|uniref:MFS family permease n=1 Tax=Aeromicrobium tamlense TaxID=375541 RepID=A0A8I0FUL4_9ACTN|nr:MFS transporter [Aeromicrobium tamlense]MBD1270900.1 MFS transporter [Aeromicrobium tamlense]NYI38291.1 MFS family permease [Aeromicrobium tamlense]
MSPVMLSAYRSILSTPGAPAFTSAGALGRLPLSMTGLGIVLLVSGRTGDYGPAGLLMAVYVVTSAICAPVQGRLADRVGQAPVLLTAGALFASGITILLTTVDLSLWVAAIGAVIAGLGAPQAGNMVRARWTHNLSDRGRLQTAFALEAVLDEVVFIVGPVLVTVLTLSVLDWSGLAVAGAAALVGAWGLALQRSTQPPHRRQAEGSREPLPWFLLGPLVVAACGLGLLFGAAEVLVVAFTEEQGRPGAAGLVLAIWSAGSLAAGLVIGALAPPADPVRRLRLSTLGLLVFLAPLPFAPNIALLAVGFLLAGLMLSPTLITAVHLVELCVPPSRLTEALTWTTTGMSAGTAAGAAIAGLMVDRWSASVGFTLPIVAALMTTSVAFWFRGPLPQRHALAE